MTQTNLGCFLGLFPNKRSKAVLSVLLIALLTLSIFFMLAHFEGGVSAQPNFLNVAISGPIKLGVNEVGTFSALVNNSFSGNLVYSWSVTPSDNNTVMASDGSNCNLTFVKATEDPYTISVTAKDSVVGNMGYASKAVYDPYTSPGYKFDASTATASYIINADGLGWYRAVRGLDGAVMTSWTSTNWATTMQNTLNVMVGTKGTLLLKSGGYVSTATINVPPNVKIIGEEMGATSITGTSGIDIFHVNTNTLITVGAHGGQISDLTLGLNNAVGIVISSLWDYDVHNVYFALGTYAIQAKNSTYTSHFYQNEFVQQSLGAIQLGFDCNGNTIEKNQFGTLNNTIAIEVNKDLFASSNYADSNKITKNYFEWGANMGGIAVKVVGGRSETISLNNIGGMYTSNSTAIWLEGANTYDNTVSDNSIEMSLGVAINLASTIAYRNTITGNSILAPLGMQIAGGQNSVISSNPIDSTSYGIKMTGGQTYTIQSNIVSMTGGTSAILVDSTASVGNSVIDNTINQGTATHAIDIERSDVMVNENHISTLSTSTGSAILAVGAWQINGNSIYSTDGQSTQIGIEGYGFVIAQINNNYIRSMGLGIYLSSNSANNTLTGNTVQGSNTYGLELDGNFNNVLGGVYKGTTGGIIDYGSGNQIHLLQNQNAWIT